MKIFEQMAFSGSEQVVWGSDPASGLKAIIAIHSTARGPALGGTRMYPYHSEEEALQDVLRLARGMTYKAAAAGLALGGGKAVLIGDPAKEKSEALLRAYGRLINTLGGRYITAEDVGTSQQDMDVIRRETKYVAGTSPETGGSGDPSPYTALGVFQGILAALGEVFGTENPAGRVVAVQGAGKVGYNLCRLLADAGARLIVSDVDEAKARKAAAEFGAEMAEPEKISGVECDLLAPCALGAAVNERTVRQFQCRIIAGAANNVLAEEKYGDLLHQMGILYVPDYVINAGGLINVAQELEPAGYRREKAVEKVKQIYDTVLTVLKLAGQENIPPFRAAARLAEERLGERGLEQDRRKTA